VRTCQQYSLSASSSQTGNVGSGSGGESLTLSGYSGGHCRGVITATDHYVSGGCTPRNGTLPVAYGFVCDADKEEIHVKQWYISRTCSDQLYAESITPNGQCFNNTLGGSSIWSGCVKVTSVTVTTYLIGGGAAFVVILIIAIVIFLRRHRKRHDITQAPLLVNHEQVEGSNSSSYETTGGGTSGGYAPSAPFAPSNSTSSTGGYGYPQQQPPQAYAQPYHTS